MATPPSLFQPNVQVTSNTNVPTSTLPQKGNQGLKKPPLQIYVDQAEGMKVIDRKGRVQNRPEILFGPSHQNQVATIWKEPLNFCQNEIQFKWNFHQFLLYFVPYFINSHEGTVVELTEGVTYSLGKTFWKEQFEKLVPSSLLNLIPEERWSFCQKHPRCYELHINFSKSTLKNRFKSHLDKFRKLILYLLVVQKLPQQLSNIQEAMQEFEKLINPPVNPEESRLQELRALIETVKSLKSSDSILEIAINPELFLRVRFASSATTVCPRLKIEPNHLSCDPTFSSPHQWLHDQIIGNLSLPLFIDEESLGKYWFDLTILGFIFNQGEIEKNFAKVLKKLDCQKAFSLGEKGCAKNQSLKVVYQWNATYFLKKFAIDFFPSETIEFLSPKKEILESQHALLQLVGSLCAGCYFLENSELIQIPLDKAHLMLPYNFDKAAQKIEQWLSQNQEECLTVFAKLLDTFFSSLQEISSQPSDPRFQAVLDKIYQSMLTQEKFRDQSLKLFLILKKPVEPAEVLALPFWLSSPLNSKLKTVFEKSPFASLFSAVEKNVQSTPLDKIEFAALITLLVFPEDKILAPAWALFKSKNYFSKSDQENAFVVSLVPQLNGKSVPFALSYVCQLALPNLEVLVNYLELTLRFSNPQMLTYETKLLERLPPIPQIPVSLLSSSPKAYQKLLASDLKQLKETLSSLESQSKSWWASFKPLYLYLECYEKSLSDLLQEAILSAPFQLYNKDGFPQAFERLAESLLKENQEASLIALIKKLPQEFFKIYAKREFTLHIFQQILERNQYKSSELRFLMEIIQPNPLEAPLLLDRLVDSYPSKIDIANALILVDDLKKDLHYFSKNQDLRFNSILHKLTDFLISCPDQKLLWSAFLPLFEMLKNEDVFIETNLQIMKKFAQMDHPPLEYFQNQIPRLRERLSEAQQKTLAQIYAPLFTTTLKTKKDREILPAIPSFHWLVKQVQTEDTVEMFSKLFLAFYPKHSLNVSHALWIGARLLQVPSLLPDFISFLLSQKNLKFTDWNQILVSFVIQTNIYTKDLLKWLLDHSPGEEKPFFQYCNQLDLQEAKDLVQAYVDPENHLSCLRKHLRKISDHSLSPDEVKLMLLLLKKLPSLYDELWSSFFKYFSIFYTPELVQIAWSLWLEKHPLVNVQTEAQTVWKEAFSIFFNVFTVSRMGRSFSDFAPRNLITLLHQFHTIACQEIAKISLNFAILVCWEENDQQAAQKLELIFAICSDELLKAKIGDCSKLIDPHLYSRLILMLIRHEDLAISEIGYQRLFAPIKNAEIDQDYSTQENLNLFWAYCDRPYIPKAPSDQYFLDLWIRNSWDALKERLNPEQVDRLINALSQFNYKDQGAAHLSFNPLYLYEMWKDFISIHPQKLNIETASNLVQKIGKHPENGDKTYKSLIQIRNELTEVSLEFQTIFAKTIFELTKKSFPSDLAILKLSLEDFRDCLKSPKSSEAMSQTLLALIVTLPSIINASVADQNLFIIIEKLLHQIFSTPWILNANFKAQYHLSKILGSLCSALKSPNSKNSISGEHQSLEKVICKILTDLFNKNHEQLTQTILLITSFFFLTHPLEDLNASDFKSIFENVPYRAIDRMLRDLLKELKSPTTFDKYSISLAAARVLRFMSFDNMNWPSAQTFFTLEFIPDFNFQENLLSQLRLRSEWVLACNSHIDELEDVQKQNPLNSDDSASSKLEDDVDELLTDDFLNSLSDVAESVTDGLLNSLPLDDSSMHEISKKFGSLKQNKKFDNLSSSSLSELMGVPEKLAYRSFENKILKLKELKEPLVSELLGKTEPLITDLRSLLKYAPFLIHFNPSLIQKKWEELFAKDEESIQITTTCALMKMMSENDFDQVGLILLQMRKRFTISLQEILINYVGSVFKTIKHPTLHDANILEKALEDFYQLFTNSNTERNLSDLTWMFIVKLPVIFKISGCSDKLLQLTRSLIDQMMKTPWIINVNVPAESHWSGLLNVLCASLLECPQENRKILEKHAFDILQTSFDSSNQILRNESMATAASHFLVLPLETLTPQDLKTLIQKIPHSNLLNLLTKLYEADPASSKPKKYCNSLAAARLIRFIKLEKGASFSKYELNPQVCATQFNPKQYLPIQFSARSEWILACENLKQYFKDHNHPDQFININAAQQDLISNLTRQILSVIKDDKSYQDYSPFLTKMFIDDVKILTILNQAIKIPLGIPEKVKENLNKVKNIIQFKIQQLPKT